MLHSPTATERVRGRRLIHRIRMNASPHYRRTQEGDPPRLLPPDGGGGGAKL
jgi:hypothetical protein